MAFGMKPKAGGGGGLNLAKAAMASKMQNLEFYVLLHAFWARAPMAPRGGARQLRDSNNLEWPHVPRVLGDRWDHDDAPAQLVRVRTPDPCRGTRHILVVPGPVVVVVCDV